MKRDARFSEVTYDSRYSKKRRPQREVVEESAAESESEEQAAASEHGEEEEEEIDMDRVNELLGVNEADNEVDAWSDESSEAQVLESSTKRLALLNYDWSKITAGDLMITFSSFLPEGGQLKKVTVYPSDFGKQRLQQEELEGPGDIFRPNSDLKEVENNASTGNPKKKKAGKEEAPKAKKLTRQTETQEWVAGMEEESALDLAKLRRYERERLKYYYAVLQFDSNTTADAVFEACNGFELEKTGIKIGMDF